MQLIYFHHLQIGDGVPPTQLPLLALWDNESISKRVRREILCDKFGSGLLNETYPISVKFYFTEDGQFDFNRMKPVQKQIEVQYVPRRVLSDDTGSGGSSGGDATNKAAPKRKVKGKLYIQFELPPGSQTDEEINAQARDELHAMWLLWKRDLDAVSHCHIDLLKSWKASHVVGDHPSENPS